MTVESGTAKITSVLGNSTPQIGIAGSGSSNMGSREDHIHPLLVPVGVYVDSHVPYLESTSTLCFFYIPSGVNYLGWDNVNDCFAYV